MQGEAIKPHGLEFPNSTDLALKLKRNADLLADFVNRGSPVSNGCDTDGVMQMPTCYQVCDNWCWATCATMVAQYYNGGSECETVECEMAETEFGGVCCPYYGNSCSNTPDDERNECNRGSSMQQVADAVNQWSSGEMTTYGPLDQDVLDYALNTGRPVIIGVHWDGGGGHALTIGGCQDGGYWLHDPWGWYDNTVDEWQWLQYDAVLRYFVTGYDSGYYGTWAESVTWDLDAYTNFTRDIVPMKKPLSV